MYYILFIFTVFLLLPHILYLCTKITFKFIIGVRWSAKYSKTTHRISLTSVKRFIRESITDIQYFRINNIRMDYLFRVYLEDSSPLWKLQLQFTNLIHS